MRSVVWCIRSASDPAQGEVAATADGIDCQADPEGWVANRVDAAALPLSTSRWSGQPGSGWRASPNRWLSGRSAGQQRASHRLPDAHGSDLQRVAPCALPACSTGPGSSPQACHQALGLEQELQRLIGGTHQQIADLDGTDGATLIAEHSQ